MDIEVFNFSLFNCFSSKALTGLSAFPLDILLRQLSAWWSRSLRLQNNLSVKSLYRKGYRFLFSVLFNPSCCPLSVPMDNLHRFGHPFSSYLFLCFFLRSHVRAEPFSASFVVAAAARFITMPTNDDVTFAGII